MYVQAAELEGFAPFQWDNISEGNGIAIAITGMFIVFTALTLITVFISALPKILGAMEPHLPTVEDHHHVPTTAESLPADEEKIVAAIGYVLRAETQHMLEH